MIDMKHAAAPANSPQAPVWQNCCVMQEMRQAPRKSTSLPAFIKGEGMFDPLPCQVIEFSATGARLRLTERDRLSSRGTMSFSGPLTLLIRLERTEVDFRVVWRHQSEFGVKFLSAPRRMAR